jgi:(1->4)-alpha-D-glucan 1-alpha-D-glucosylmutase
VTAPPPVSTYRVQVRPEFGFDDVNAVVDHLSALGVTHVYLSPVLQPVPGSQHGYDVIDHSRINAEAGGEAGFARLSTALAEAGMSAIVDVVPNHMAVPTPVRLNEELWSVLRLGRDSPFARWFDVDWSAEPHAEGPGARAVLMPVLGQRIGAVIAAGELTVDRSGREPVLRYHDHEFPIRPGTENLPLTELVDRQWYRLAWWRVSDDELNYRRFFDVDTLAAVRVEDDEVFALTHALLVDMVNRGQLAGLRIDHPDGLADPRAYLERLAEATDGAWVVVEKILEGEENLPYDWRCAGTTGYDALAQVGGLFVDPAGAAPLSELLTEVTADATGFEQIVEQSKRQVVAEGLYAEVNRLVELLVQICADDVRLRDHTRRHLEAAVVELLVAFDRYRAYVVPGVPASDDAVVVVERAVATAREHDRLPEEAWDTLDLVKDLVQDRPVASPVPFKPVTDAVAERQAARRAEFVVRFQQTCGPVMAKGLEDTAFYRWHRLVALNEVGGDPLRFGVPPEAFHDIATRQQRDWPQTMTTLSTHDTKRSEDVRARLYALTELTSPWAEAVRSWNEAAADLRTADGWPGAATIYLTWQTLIGTWGTHGPLDLDRLGRFLTKSTREAKQHTSWTRPNPEYDAAVQAFAGGVLAHGSLMASIGEFAAMLDGPARVAVLGQKLVQLTMPGVPDVYQGCELVDLSLVDPDNRREVDFDERRRRLARLDAGEKPADLDDEKLLVTATALRLRREHPGWFVASDALYRPLPTSTGNAVAFGRGAGDEVSAVTVATRLPVALARRGGWGEHTLSLPWPGPWRDLLTGEVINGGLVALDDVLAMLPVALLVRAGER